YSYNVLLYSLDMALYGYATLFHWRNSSRTRTAEQISAAGPPVDPGHPYCPLPPRLQGRTRAVSEQITGAGPLINPSHLYHPVPPRLHSRMRSIVEQTNTTGQCYTHI
ncbi:hypothetical protein BDQ17DRAFT_1333418, partial [Cyathus striatus]